MQSLVIFLTAMLFVTSVARAHNCTAVEVYTALEPVASDANFVTCQSDSNYTLLSFKSPSLNQSEAFCASSACQTLLNTTLSSGLLPDLSGGHRRPHSQPHERSHHSHQVLNESQGARS
ncbi:hypothetical protein PF010_g7934 [Phytophthora fragariae]|uniref:Elicitin n=1 Tax=Phytophthora fragariae TaxID=53985 RepID=A0A6G0LGQ7_9STRA|nr:hypothetical protein PF010_g7934 [Phytophthora fragariae]